MMKAGGLVGLIAGILAIFATVAAVLFDLFVSPEATSNTFLFLFGGLFISFVVIAISAIILNSRHSWTGLLLVAASVLGIFFNLGGGFVTICLVLAIVGGIMATWGRSNLSQSTRT